MEIYLVGGAVRDRLLGLPVQEKDWVVVGQTREAMLKQGYQQVGKDFPVFLHPETQEEYALARTERKKGRGYSGFEVFANPSVSLEQDLARRDLTINAIAEDAQGNLIDPFDGQKDLQAQKLCHVSPAFAEDPLRVLRLARFAAKLPAFTIAAETKRLCSEMVKDKELDFLTKERVWQEWEKVWKTTEPGRFIEVLASLKAWEAIMPLCYKPEEDQEKLNVLRGKVADNRLFAVLGLYLSPKEYAAYQRSLAVPVKVKDLAKVVYEMIPHYSAWGQDPEKIVRLLQKVDAVRRQERFAQALEIISYLKGNGQGEKKWLNLVENVAEVRPNPEWLQGEKRAIGQLLQEKKVNTVTVWQQKIDNNQG